MINQIEDAIISRLRSMMSSAAGVVEVQKGIEGIPQPAVYVSTEAGSFAQVGQRSCKQTLTIFVDIIFSHLSDERERRKGIYLILAGVLQVLMFQRLGLQITALMPKNWKNTTYEELRKQGLIAFSLELSTSYIIEMVDDEAVTDLLTVGLNYYLTPGDDVVDAVDIVSTGA